MATLQQIIQERFFEALINGDRPAARDIVSECQKKGADAKLIITDLFWPTYESIEKLWRADQLSSMSYHFATRLLRTLIDQNAQNLTLSNGSNGRTVLASCGTSQSEELGSQMAIDMLEDCGYRVRFMGGGVSPDEIMSSVQENKPDILLMFCSAAADLPGIRFVIDNLREIGAACATQIVVGGGVFNRAEGLAEEIGADLWASDPLDLVEILATGVEVRAVPEQRTVGKLRPVKAGAPAATSTTATSVKPKVSIKNRAAA